ncbi:MAG: hypothetical protein GY923_15345 [Aestuariibacter sp.]|nr:hypothetical protein [Aestuariibacter sp.]
MSARKKLEKYISEHYHNISHFHGKQGLSIKICTLYKVLSGETVNPDLKTIVELSVATDGVVSVDDWTQQDIEV